jgi:hypothetical protein
MPRPSCALLTCVVNARARWRSWPRLLTVELVIDPDLGDEHNPCGDLPQVLIALRGSATYGPEVVTPRLAADSDSSAASMCCLIQGVPQATN